MYDKVEIVAGVVAGLVVDEVCYAGAVRGGGEFGGVGWKTGKPVLEFYFEFVGVHRGGCFEVVIECRVMLNFFSLCLLQQWKTTETTLSIPISQTQALQVHFILYLLILLIDAILRPR